MLLGRSFMTLQKFQLFDYWLGGFAPGLLFNDGVSVNAVVIEDNCELNDRARWVIARRVIVCLSLLIVFLLMTWPYLDSMFWGTEVFYTGKLAAKDGGTESVILVEMKREWVLEGGLLEYKNKVPSVLLGLEDNPQPLTSIFFNQPETKYFVYWKVYGFWKKTKLKSNGRDRPKIVREEGTERLFLSLSDREDNPHYYVMSDSGILELASENQTEH